MSFARDRKRTPSFKQALSIQGDSPVEAEFETIDNDIEKKTVYEFIDLDWESDSESKSRSSSRSSSSIESGNKGGEKGRRSESDSEVESSDEDEPDFSDFVPIKYISEGAFGQVRAFLQ